ncbi:MAG: MerR family transcriptional regulator [Hyphomicrobiales bacterium]|nr:MerR family transcriptional regulator [Hyphomicrobiales bacterium]
MEKSPEAFRTIREVADATDLPQHVLRFWETRFPQIRPLKRAGGRRYYRPDDVERVRLIRRLLYDEGYTIKGVQKLFKEQGAQALTGGTPLLGSPEAGPARGQEDPASDLRALTSSAGNAESPEMMAEKPTPHAPAPEAEVAVLRQALADIQHAARILSRARSSDG